MEYHYASDHPSPSKKRRTTQPTPSTRTSSALPQSAPPLLPLPAPPHSTASHTPTPPQPPLQPLPPVLSLLALASSLRQSSLSLLPSLAKRPSTTSNSSQSRYAYAWNAYCQARVGCVVALRAACAMAATGEYRGGRIELRSCAMLAEVVVEGLEETKDGKPSGEAEEALAKALSIAQSHPSLHPYLPPVQLLQLRLSIATQKPLKHTRQLLRRLLASLPPTAAPSTTAAQAAAYYSAQTIAATLPSKEVSDVERMAAWRTLAETASERGDAEVACLASLNEARLALENADYARTSSLVGTLSPTLGGDTPETEGAGWREARILFRFLRTVLLAQVGDMKAAKECLKETHKLLDAPSTLGGASQEGVVQATVHSAKPPTSSTTSAGSVTLPFPVPSHSTLYLHTYHLSTTLHSDALGRSPRSLLFATEGLRLLSTRLNARDSPHPGTAVPTLRSINDELRVWAGVKVAVLGEKVRVEVMRGMFGEAEKGLEEAVEIAKRFGMWGDSEGGEGETERDGEESREVKENLTLGWGLVRLARSARGGEDETEARRCFEAVCWSIASSSPSTTSSKSSSSTSTSTSAVNPRRRHTHLLSSLSLLLLLFSSDTTSRPTSSLPPLTALPTQPSAQANLAHLLAQALTAKEITATKTALSGALSLANGLQANFVRMGVLGVLGVVFGWTREGEALKMLQSCYKLSSSMGPSTRLVSVATSSASLASTSASASVTTSSSIFPGAAASDITPAAVKGKEKEKGKEEEEEGHKVLVGSARLQGWAAERLLESLNSDARTLSTCQGRAMKEEYERVGDACRRWVEGL